MKRTIRLTESELRNVITESVKSILKEGQNDTATYTHYAVHKPSKKIVNGWDYSGYDPEELKMYKNDYFTADLIDMEMNPKEIAIWGRRKCEREGLNPADDNSWANYFEIVKESLLKEIGDTAEGQKKLGALQARKKMAHKSHIPIYNYAEKARGGDDWDKLAWPNASIDTVNPMYKHYAQGYTDYINSHPDEMVAYNHKRYGRMNEAANNHSFETVEIDLGDIQFPEGLEEFITEHYDSMPQVIEVVFEFVYNPYVPATYWQPAEGDDFDLYSTKVLADEFANIIPPEYFDEFVATIESYADANFEDFMGNSVYRNDDGPDPDEAHESYLEKKYGI